MDDKKYNGNVRMQCATCGSETFEFEGESADEMVRATCVRCGRKYTRDQLISENSETIESHLDNVKKEVVRDAAAELRKAFKGVKGIDFR